MGALWPAGRTGGTLAAADVLRIHSSTDVSARLEQENDVTVLDVRAPSGRGSVRLALEHGQWRDLSSKLVVRLHLRGLDSLRVVVGSMAISASISCSLVAAAAEDSATCVQTLDCEGEPAQVLEPSSPMWLNIDICGPSTALPLGETSYFDVHLPEDLACFSTYGCTLIEILFLDFYS